MSGDDIVLQIEMDLIRAFVIILLGVGIWAFKLLLAKLGIQLTAAQKAELQDIADKALAYGFSQAQGEILTHGWDHIAVKNKVLEEAAPYALTKFDQGLKRSGIPTADPVKAGEQLAGILNRRYADAAAKAAASPATPPEPPRQAPAAAPAPVAPVAGAG